jgi:hypothetical protein
VLYCTDKRGKSRTTEAKKQVDMKLKEKTRETKKFLAGSSDFSLL